MNAAQFLTGGGDMGARVRAHDWSASPVGPIETWSQPLHITLGFVLNCGFPKFLAWGPELISFYNDAYRPILGTKEALGRPMREVWAEAWDEVGSMVARAFSGEPTYFEDLPLTLERKGYSERSWWTFSYSPIRDETAQVAGVLCTVLETTARVRSNGRLQFQIDLSNDLRGSGNASDAMAVAVERLGRYLRASRAGYGDIDAKGAFLSVGRGWTDEVTPSVAAQTRLPEFGLRLVHELQAGNAIRVDDVLTDSRVAGGEHAPAFGASAARSLLAVPSMRGNQLAAVLYVQGGQPRQWRDDEVAMVEETIERTWEAVGRVQAETALRKSEAMFRLFAEHSTSVLWIFNIERKAFEYLSLAFERVWGQTSDAPLQDHGHWAETIHPEDRAGVLDAPERVLRDKAAFTHHYRIQRPDGSVRWIRDTIFPIRGDGEELRRVGGIAQDITRTTEAIVHVIDADDTSRKARVLLLRGSGYQVQPFATFQAFRERMPALSEGCIILDVHESQEKTIVTLLHELKVRRVRFPVIAVNRDQESVKFAVRVMKAGAVDYLQAQDDPEALLAAVATALAEAQEATNHDDTVELAQRRISAMSVRELEVLQGMLAGATNKEIARELKISPRTVEIHRAHLIERLGAHTSAEAMLLATSAGLKSTWPPVDRN